MQVTIETYNPDDLLHVRALTAIAHWGQEHCVASPLDRAGQMRHLLGAVAVDRDANAVCGYGAIKRAWSPTVVEFGGLVVYEACRGRGVASALVRHTLDAWRRQPTGIPHVIAFANAKSIGLFEQLGGIQLGSKRNYLKSPPALHIVEGKLRSPPGGILPESLENRTVDLTPVK